MKYLGGTFYLCAGVVFFGVLLPPKLAVAEAFDCAHDKCGIGIDGEYPNLVVGTIDGVASQQQEKEIFIEARKQGLWSTIPAGADEFAKRIQVVSINVAPGRSLTVTEARAEMDTTPVKIGDFVRFSPHRGAYDTPHPRDPYWFTFGCVAVLCNAADHACQQGFQAGIYRVSDGVELDSKGLHPLEGGAVIDVMSMRIKKQSN